MKTGDNSKRMAVQFDDKNSVSQVHEQEEIFSGRPRSVQCPWTLT